MTFAANTTQRSPESESIHSQNGNGQVPLTTDSLDITVLINADGIVTYVSPSVTAYLDYGPEEITGYHARLLVYPDDLDTLQRMLARLVEAPGKSLTFECRLL